MLDKQTKILKHLKPKQLGGSNKGTAILVRNANIELFAASSSNSEHMTRQQAKPAGTSKL